MTTKGILFNKDKQIAELSFNPETLEIHSFKILDVDRLPIHIHDGKKVKLKLAEEWLRSRTIPMSRENFDMVMNNAKVQNAYILAYETMFLSLSDQYWISPVNLLGTPTKTWDKVNFYTNDFSTDVGKLFFKKSNESINNVDPITTTNGKTNKCWVIKNGERVFVKGSSSDDRYHQQPFNESIISKAMRKMGISNRIDYEIHFIEYDGVKTPVTYSKAYCDENTEIVPLEHLLLIGDRKELPGKSEIMHVLQNNLMKYNLLPMDVKCFMDMVRVVDWIFMNRERNLNNFCFIRNFNNPNTLKIGPVHDNGNSMLYSEEEIIEESIHHFEAKMDNFLDFETLNSILSFVDAKCINIGRIEGFADIAREELLKSDMSKERINSLVEMISKRETIAKRYLTNKKINPDIASDISVYFS